MNNKTFWNGLSHEGWSLESNRRWEQFQDGETTITIDKNTGIWKLDTGRYVLVQRECLLSLPPGPVFRETFWGGAMKAFLPPNAGVGDKMRVKRVSRSGKSLILEIAE